MSAGPPIHLVPPPRPPQTAAELVRAAIEEHESDAPRGSVKGQEDRRIVVVLTALLADILLLEVSHGSR